MQRPGFWIASVSLVILAACGSSEVESEPQPRSKPVPATSKTQTAGPVLLDTAKVEKGIRRKFLKDYAPAHPGDSLTSVSCPADISGTIGDETTCDIEFSDGSYGRMTIKVVDATGNFNLVGASKS